MPNARNVKIYTKELLVLTHHRMFDLKNRFDFGLIDFNIF